jgi:hypothetical protein
MKQGNQQKIELHNHSWEPNLDDICTLKYSIYIFNQQEELHSDILCMYDSKELTRN